MFMKKCNVIQDSYNPPYWCACLKMAQEGFECLKHAFENLDKVVSFTTLNILNSQAVMERLGMKNTY